MVKPEARPIFKKPRPVPFTIKASIDKELDELEANGVISKVFHSDWAAPIVPVPKKMAVSEYVETTKSPLIRYSTSISTRSQSLRTYSLH